MNDGHSLNIRSLQRPKAICLDLDNTIYPYAPSHEAGMQAVFSKIKEFFSITDGQEKSYFKEARQQIKLQLGSTGASHSRLLYFQRMMELMGLKTQMALALDLEQTYWREYIRKSCLFNGVKDFLYTLRRNEIVTAIVSDLTTQIQFRKIIYFGIDGLIDHVVTSEEAGADKPDPKIFNLAIKKLAISPNEIWMIGDELEKDIMGATRCGMVGILKTDTSRHDRSLSFQNFNTLSSLPFLSD